MRGGKIFLISKEQFGTGGSVRIMQVLLDIVCDFAFLL